MNSENKNIVYENLSTKFPNIFRYRCKRKLKTVLKGPELESTPSIGWMFPCYFCGQITSKTYEYSDYIVYRCKDCKNR